MKEQATKNPKPDGLQAGETINSEFERAKKFLAEHSSFILSTHARTDGDDLGSMLAIYSLLKSMGKRALPVVCGGVPQTLKFLPGQDQVLEKFPEPKIFMPGEKRGREESEAIILFGCYAPSRTELPEIINSKLPILNCDHHHDNRRYGAVNLVDEHKSSVAELIFDFIKYLKADITPEISKCLLTGMFTDTGSFMHANTSASTFKAAAEMMKHRARIDNIYYLTFNNKGLDALRAWGKALENTVLVDARDRFVLSVLTAEDMAELGPIGEDTFLGFADTLSRIPEAKFSIFIRQEGEYIKGSIRSEERKNVNVFEIAKLFGGGGHPLASAFRIKGRLVKVEDGQWQVGS